MKDNRWLGGWQINQSTIIQSGLPFNVTYRDAGADRDTGPNRPNLIGAAQRRCNRGAVKVAQTKTSEIEFRLERSERLRQTLLPCPTLPGDEGSTLKCCR